MYYKIGSKLNRITLEGHLLNSCIVPWSPVSVRGFPLVWPFLMVKLQKGFSYWSGIRWITDTNLSSFCSKTLWIRKGESKVTEGLLYYSIICCSRRAHQIVLLTDTVIWCSSSTVVLSNLIIFLSHLFKKKLFLPYAG